MGMNRRLFLPLTLVPFLWSSLGRSHLQEVQPREPVTVILLRHAEVETEAGVKILSEKGRERALAVARLLDNAGVTHLFSSGAVRTRQTLEPLARAKGLEIQSVPAKELDRQVALLEALPPGSVAVVAGHSNTVPAMVSALGGGTVTGLTDSPYGPLIAEDVHDRVFLLTLPGVKGAAVKTVELKLGR